MYFVDVQTITGAEPYLDEMSTQKLVSEITSHILYILNILIFNFN